MSTRKPRRGKRGGKRARAKALRAAARTDVYTATPKHGLAKTPLNVPSINEVAANVAVNHRERANRQISILKVVSGEHTPVAFDEFPGWEGIGHRWEIDEDLAHDRLDRRGHAEPGDALRLVKDDTRILEARHELARKVDADNIKVEAGFKFNGTKSQRFKAITRSMGARVRKGDRRDYEWDPKSEKWITVE